MTWLNTYPHRPPSSPGCSRLTAHGKMLDARQNGWGFDWIMHNSTGAMSGVGEGETMSRYFVQRRKQPVRASDDWEPIGNAWHIPAVADHEAADTELLNVDGDPIMRAPNEMGFVWTSTGNHNSEGE